MTFRLWDCYKQVSSNLFHCLYNMFHFWQKYCNFTQVICHPFNSEKEAFKLKGHTSKIVHFVIGINFCLTSTKQLLNWFLWEDFKDVQELFKANFSSWYHFMRATLMLSLIVITIFQINTIFRIHFLLHYLLLAIICSGNFHKLMVLNLFPWYPKSGYPKWQYVRALTAISD